MSTSTEQYSHFAATFSLADGKQIVARFPARFFKASGLRLVFDQEEKSCELFSVEPPRMHEDVGDEGKASLTGYVGRSGNYIAFRLPEGEEIFEKPFFFLIDRKAWEEPWQEGSQDHVIVS